MENWRSWAGVCVMVPPRGSRDRALVFVHVCRSVSANVVYVRGPWCEAQYPCDITPHAHLPSPLRVVRVTVSPSPRLASAPRSCAAASPLRTCPMKSGVRAPTFATASSARVGLRAPDLNLLLAPRLI